jgi:hypothetical protein
MNMFSSLTMQWKPAFCDIRASQLHLPNTFGKLIQFEATEVALLARVHF